MTDLKTFELSSFTFDTMLNRLWAIDDNWRHIRNVRYGQLTQNGHSSRYLCIALGYYALTMLLCGYLLTAATQLWLRVAPVVIKWV